MRRDVEVLVFAALPRDATRLGCRHSFTRPARALAHQLLGAITYFAVSDPTLNRILGKKAFDNMQATYE